MSVRVDLSGHTLVTAEPDRKKENEANQTELDIFSSLILTSNSSSRQQLSRKIAMCSQLVT